MEKEAYIQFLANKSNQISMNNTNSKLGADCLNLAMPLTTCRWDAPCRKGCYANKGTQKFANVQATYYRNLRLYEKDSEDFFDQMYCKIAHSKQSKVRLFDAGDLPSFEFLDRLVKVCKRIPDVKFMFFTKKYEIVNCYIALYTLPDNLNIIFSAWDKNWTVPNPHNLAIAYVDFKDKDMNSDIPKYAFKCPGRESTCSDCGVCWNKKLKAVVFEQH